MILGETSKMQRAAELMAGGRLSLAKVALQAGVSYSTIHRWKNDPDFLEVVQKCRKNLLKTMASYVDRDSRLLALSQMAEQARKQWEEQPWLTETRMSGGMTITNTRPNAESFQMFLKAIDQIAKIQGEHRAKVEIHAEEKTVGVTVHVPEMTAEAFAKYTQMRATAAAASSLFEDEEREVEEDEEGEEDEED